MCEKLNFINLAIKNYTQINKNNSKNWRSRFNLYLIYINQKNYGQALKLVNEVLIIKNNYQPALRDKALILYYLKKPDKSLSFILKSINQNPSDYIALNTLGLCYLAMKQYEDAKKIFKQGIKVNPKYSPSYNNLGRCYSLTYDRKTADSYYKKALAIHPDFFEAINNLANNFSETGSYEMAIKYYHKALKISPEKPEVLYNIGVAYVYLNKFRKAEEFYKKARAINPNDDLLKRNYSILLLALQRYKEAWKFFDGRLKLDEFRFKNNIIHNIKNRLWKGEKINKNDRILVIKEQGIGDEILYASMYPDLLSNYHNVKIETDPRLISLFERSYKTKDKFVPYTKYSKDKNKLKKFDIIIFAASLGKIFRNSLSDFPKNNFLIAEKKRCVDLNEKLNLISKKYKIGVSWRSRTDTTLLGPAKSLNLNLLLPILKMNQFTFINLQYGDTVKEINNFYSDTKIKIHTIKEVDLFNDFESISALAKNLDLFITVSNSTAHVSAALGVPTWVIKPKNHSVFHYWNQPNDTTPWYSEKSIKLFSYKDGWTKTVENLKEEIIKKFN